MLDIKELISDAMNTAVKMTVEREQQKLDIKKLIASGRLKSEIIRLQGDGKIDAAKSLELLKTIDIILDDMCIQPEDSPNEKPYTSGDK